MEGINITQRLRERLTSLSPIQTASPRATEIERIAKEMDVTTVTIYRWVRNGVPANVAEKLSQFI
jgi:transposase-like protein